MELEWGQEIVLKCCRYWLTHNANGTWGNCGFCRKHPTLTEYTWDEAIRAGLVRYPEANS